jgi:hypothetical protein
MSDQLGSSHLQSLFDTALQDYKTKTGIVLDKHPFAEELQNCDSVESLTAVLNSQTEAFNQFRENDKILKPLKNTLSVLHKLSAAAKFIGLVRRGSDWAFNLPNSHPPAFLARNSNRNRPQYPALCMYLFLVLQMHSFVIYKRIRQPRASLTTTMHWESYSSQSGTS